MNDLKGYPESEHRGSWEIGCCKQSKRPESSTTLGSSTSQFICVLLLFRQITGSALCSSDLPSLPRLKKDAKRTVHRYPVPFEGGKVTEEWIGHWLEGALAAKKIQRDQWLRQQSMGTQLEHGCLMLLASILNGVALLLLWVLSFEHAMGI